MSGRTRVVSLLAVPCIAWSAAAFAQTRTQQPWQGGVQSAPLAPPPGAVPDVPRDDSPGGPGVPSIMAPPAGVAPAAPPPGTGRAGVPQPGDMVPGGSGEIEIVQPPSQKIVNKTAVFSGLDKITGRIISFDVAINETVQFGALRITPRACYTRPSTETQNTTGFVEVQEIELDGEVKRLFGGWMFAASPGLHGVEHPIYDVWLTDCKQSAPVIAKPAGQQ
ncbi:DUF2155 domain-containing protein [Ancylobacter terrae]|uniref:DUF2155 domain-containing protein n=1 Tax=Ancylobacter sp. sgz301288 TaxID=3342077 RepID=UPI00385F46A2